MKKTWTQKINQLKLAKWARKRWGRGGQFYIDKKKFNRKRDNQKVDPYGWFDGTVGED